MNVRAKTRTQNNTKTQNTEQNTKVLSGSFFVLLLAHVSSFSFVYSPDTAEPSECGLLDLRFSKSPALNIFSSVSICREIKSPPLSLWASLRTVTVSALTDMPSGTEAITAGFHVHHCSGLQVLFQRWCDPTLHCGLIRGTFHIQLGWENSRLGG